MPTKKTHAEYINACLRACKLSATDDYKGCTVNVNALVSKVDGFPEITGYVVSDWYSSESTVAQFRNGKEV